MTQADRDRMMTLKKVKRKLITQRQQPEELCLTVRQIQRLVKALQEQGDKAVIHGLRGRPSPRRIPDGMERKVVEILSAPNYEGFGPTLGGRISGEETSHRGE